LLLRRELETARRQSDAYLFHAYLNVTNQAYYLEEIVQRAARHHLEYVGDADPAAMWPGNWPPEGERRLAEFVAGGVPGAEPSAAAQRGDNSRLVDFEQMLDFARGSASRRSLFCRAGAAVQLMPRSGFQGLHLSAPLQRQASPAGAPPGSESWSTTAGQTITAGDPELRAALSLLCDAWPESRPWQWLAGEVARRAPDSTPSELRRGWHHDLLRCFSLGALDISVRANPCGRTIADRPVASRFARRQAAVQPLATNLRHMTVRLNPLDRLVLEQLDGGHTADELERSIGQSGSGDVVDAAAIRDSLSRLARHAFLFGARE
jgi:hypothetical protein